MCSAIAHPATRREQQSITVARYKLPPVANGRYVMSYADVRNMPTVLAMVQADGGAEVQEVGIVA